MKVKVSAIESAGNIRLDFGDVQAMADSMTINGQVEPITVHSKNGNGQYIVDDGHRRLAAAKLIGLDALDVVVKDAPEDRAAFQFVVNEHRKGLSYSERAEAIRTMINTGKTQAEVARITGLSETEVSLALSALKACPKILDAVNTGVLAPSAIEPLLSLSNDDQEALADAAIKEKTVRKITALVKTYKARKALASAPVSSSNDDDNPFDSMVLEALTQARDTLAALSGMLVTPATQIKTRQLAQEIDNILHVNNWR